MLYNTHVHVQYLTDPTFKKTRVAVALNAFTCPRVSTKRVQLQTHVIANDTPIKHVLLF